MLFFAPRANRSYSLIDKTTRHASTPSLRGLRAEAGGKRVHNKQTQRYRYTYIHFTTLRTGTGKTMFDHAIGANRSQDDDDTHGLRYQYYHHCVFFSTPNNYETFEPGLRRERSENSCK